MLAPISGWMEYRKGDEPWTSVPMPYVPDQRAFSGTMRATTGGTYEYRCGYTIMGERYERKITNRPSPFVILNEGETVTIDIEVLFTLG